MIFDMLNCNEDTKRSLDLLRTKLPTRFRDETNHEMNVIMVTKVISSSELLYLYHPCICDIYHDNVVKPEHLHP